ncbi:MAG: cytochrome b/b6 domain-containing protein [Deltaproteobacteria bacterium]|nr:cytochrome b/b6 domain-containing protein [Deltaproteobacteria bacterium]
MTARLIKRHTKTAMFMHWFNAVCWLFLLATGMGLIQNENLMLAGGIWPRWMRAIFGGGDGLLLAHEIVGLVWAGVFFLYGILCAKREVIPFIREIFAISPGRDLSWLLKKGTRMTLGRRTLTRFGINPTLPDQGFYNVGQKLFAVPSLFGGIIIGITGLIMFFSDKFITNTTWVQWAIWIHFVTVGLVFAGLFIHVYMASIAAGERPAFKSMFTGTVPDTYAKGHHRLWYDQINQEGK